MAIRSPVHSVEAESPVQTSCCQPCPGPGGGHGRRGVPLLAFLVRSVLRATAVLCVARTIQRSFRLVGLKNKSHSEAVRPLIVSPLSGLLMCSSTFSVIHMASVFP